MVTLANFPMVSQRSTVTSDGKVSENALYDCVPSSIGACMLWLEGKSQWDPTVNADKLKDAVYGDAYTGGTAAVKYVDVCKSMGFHLYSVDTSDAAHTVAMARQMLAQNKPVIFTELDPYVDTNLPQYRDWTHVCVWYADDASGLTAMDPFIAKPIYKSDTTWANLLRANQVWSVEKIAMNVLPPGWHDDGTTLSTASGELVLGFRAHVLPLLLAGKWNPANQPLGKQYYTKQLEASNPLLGDGDQIILTEAMLGYPHNPQAQYEGLKNKVIEEYVGTELDYTRKQVAKYYAAATQAQAQVTQLQAQLTQLQQANPDALAAIHQAQAILAPFK